MVRHISIHTTLSLLIVLGYGAHSYAAPRVDFGVNINGPECFDGIDNDDDGFTDFPDDKTCGSALEDREDGPPALRFSNRSPAGSSRGGFYVEYLDEEISRLENHQEVNLFDFISTQVKAIGSNLFTKPDTNEDTDGNQATFPPLVSFDFISTQVKAIGSNLFTKPDTNEDTDDNQATFPPLVSTESAAERLTSRPPSTSTESAAERLTSRPPSTSTEPATDTPGATTSTTALPIKTDMPTLPPAVNLAAWLTTGLFFRKRPAYLCVVYNEDNTLRLAPKKNSITHYKQQYPYSQSTS